MPGLDRRPQLAPRPVLARRLVRAFGIALLAVGALPLTGCADGVAPPASSAPATSALSATSAAGTSGAAGWPTPAGPLTDEQSRWVYDRAAAAISAQQTMAVAFSYERTDGFCVPLVLNPTLRLDLRDPARGVAALALSILASNVAVGGQVYRQQPDPRGDSTVWVRDPEPRAPLEFVLWKPGAAGARVAYLGAEEVAGQQTRHYRVFDPGAYAGPTGPSGAGPTPSREATPCRTPSPAPSATGPSGTVGTGAGPAGQGSGIGDYDDFWLGEDGAPRRLVSVLGDLRLTSRQITYGGAVSIAVPDVGAAISEEEFRRRQAQATSAPSR